MSPAPACPAGGPGIRSPGLPFPFLFFPTPGSREASQALGPQQPVCMWPYQRRLRPSAHEQEALQGAQPLGGPKGGGRRPAGTEPPIPAKRAPAATPLGPREILFPREMRSGVPERLQNGARGS